MSAVEEKDEETNPEDNPSSSLQCMDSQSWARSGKKCSTYCLTTTRKGGKMSAVEEKDGETNPEVNPSSSLQCMDSQSWARSGKKCSTYCLTTTRKEGKMSAVEEKDEETNPEDNPSSSLQCMDSQSWARSGKKCSTYCLTTTRKGGKMSAVEEKDEETNPEVNPSSSLQCMDSQSWARSGEKCSTYCLTTTRKEGKMSAVEEKDEETNPEVNPSSSLQCTDSQSWARSGKKCSTYCLTTTRKGGKMSAVEEKDQETNTQSPEDNPSSSLQCTDSQSVDRPGKKVSIYRLTANYNVLPPCRVCGGSASGFHYGVNTCEACKRFFRRSMHRKRSLKCRGDNKCPQTDILLCGHCRYRRCLAVGMSRTAIKTGRYSHEKKCSNLQEAQQLSRGLSSFYLSEEEVASTTKTLMEAFRHVVTNVDVPQEEMERALRERIETFRLRSEMFGGHRNLTEEQYNEVYNSTGLDVDGRRQHGAFVMKSLEFFVIRFVSFAKEIPGFSTLSLNDQAVLLKEHWVHIWFFAGYRGFNSELGGLYPPNRDCRTREEMERTIGAECMEASYGLAGKMQKLDLSKEEIVFLCAVNIFSTDNCELEAPGRVEELQWFLVRCLLHSLRRRYRVRTFSVFARIVDSLVEMQSAVEIVKRTLVCTHFSDIIQTHPMLMDML